MGMEKNTHFKWGMCETGVTKAVYICSLYTFQGGGDYIEVETL